MRWMVLFIEFLREKVVAEIGGKVNMQVACNKDLKRASLGNGIALTMAFPNGVWERGADRLENRFRNGLK